MNRVGAIAALALLVCPGWATAARAPDWVIRARATVVDPVLVGGVPAPDAVVLWRQQIVTAASLSGASKLFERRAVKLLTPGAASGLVFQSTYDDDSSVDVEGAWTLHPDGNSESLDLRSVVSVQLANAEYFTDTHVMTFRPPRPSPGDIAAYALSRKSRRDVYQWILALQSDNPIAAQEVAIDLPDGWTHRWRLSAAPDGYTGPMSGEGGAKASYPFAAQRAVRFEDHAPPERECLAALQIVVLPPTGKFSELVFRSWADVGGWFYRKSLGSRTSIPPAAVPEFSGDVVVQSAQWVQDRIRYVAVEVGEGGYVPRQPALVASRLYGDCKDKAFLLMAILARAGIEAIPVLTRGRDDGTIDPAFPSPIQFNHLILAVRTKSPTGLASEVVLPGGQTAVVFDPTDTWTAYGRLPAQLQGARGLFVRPDGAELLDLPYAPAPVNHLTRTVEAEVTEEGVLEAEVSEATDGALSERGYYQRHTPLERSEGIDQFAERSIRGSHATKLEIANLEERSKPMEARFHVHADNFLRRTGSLLLMPMVPFSVGPARVAGDSQRRFPIELGVPKRREAVMRVKLPPGTRPEALPKAIDVQNAYARYTFSADAEDGKIAIRESYEVRAPVVPVGELAAWRLLESAAVKAAATKVVLVRGRQP